MKPSAISLALLPFLLAATPAAAQIIGKWHVTGAVNGRAFAADCAFTPAAAGFGGACIDDSNGRKHALTTGTVSGSQVQWSYPASYMMMSFTVRFVGTLTGAGMNGTITAAGRKGAFSAVRQN
jgi:hypothetical protein